MTWSACRRQLRVMVVRCEPGGRERSGHLHAGVVGGMVATSPAKATKNRTMNPP